MTLSSPETSSLSWEDVFFNGLDVLPESNIIWPMEKSIPPKLFTSEDLLWGKALREINRDHRMIVRRALADGQPVVVKSFRAVTDQEARWQYNRLPAPGYSLDQVKQDMDPFVLEQRAYETIHQRCSDTEKGFFPVYLGTLQGVPRRDPAIVLEYLRPSLRCRCIFSQTVPSWLNTELQLLNESLQATATTRKSQGYAETIIELEKSWYESLLIDRLKRLTALHNIGVTHGDIKEEHFRANEDDFHDTPLFDFSRSYTFTPQRPYKVQSMIIDNFRVHRSGTFYSMQKIVQMERKHTRNLVRDRVEKNSFCEHLMKICPLTDCKSLRVDSQDEELIGMRVFRMPEEFSFPSFASILPFLEEASIKKTPSWLLFHLSSLLYYIAAWIGYPQDVQAPCLISISAGNPLDSCAPASVISSTCKYDKCYMLLFPSKWIQNDVCISPYLMEKILSERHRGQKTWTVDRKVFDMHMANVSQ